MIEAWNEWGEGSTIEPSVEHRFDYLDQIRSVFCPASGVHNDVDPKSLGIHLPVFDLKLPSTDSWRFDFDNEGWTSMNVKDLKAADGAIGGASLNGDPQLYSPATYLKCDQYPAFHLRMRATHPNGGPENATGQVFWSTVETGMSEAASVTFPVQLDGKWHDYTIDLSRNPHWRSRTDKLRLDPVDVADVTFQVDEFSLCRSAAR
jgi:hypothetical protein